MTRERMMAALWGETVFMDKTTDSQCPHAANLLNFYCCSYKDKKDWIYYEEHEKNSDHTGK